MSDKDTQNAIPERISPLSDQAIGAAAALLRVAELYDPAVAHRAALRAVIADLLSTRLDTAIDRSVLIAAAALGDIDLAVTRPTDPESENDSTRALLAATILGRLPGLRVVASAVGARSEWWDGNGFPNQMAGEEIPLAGRVLVVTDSLVAYPAAGFVPSWDHARRRILAASATMLDPALVQIAVNLPLEDIEAPAIPSATVERLLDGARATSPRRELTETASTIKSAVTSAGDAEDVLALFARTACEAVGARDVQILPCTPTTISLKPVAQGLRGDTSAGPPIESFDFSLEAELRAGVSLEHSTRGDQHIDQLLAPILTGDDCWGVIVARRDRGEEAFDAADLGALRHVASETAAAIGRSEHWAEMERMALCDQLTGLANRHELYRVLDDIFERVAVDRVDTALIMCDVDGLKIVNDTRGHQAGDRLLVDAAAAMRASVRDPDRTTVCRIGGDEFCMVIDGGALLSAHEVSESIGRLFARSGGSSETRSISCGIAFAGQEIESRSALLRAADENQYITKRARRAERTEVAETEMVGRLHDRRALRD